MFGIRVTRCRKVYVGNARIHHGLAGLVAMAAGLLAVIHDWADRPWRLKDK